MTLGTPAARGQAPDQGPYAATPSPSLPAPDAPDAPDVASAAAPVPSFPAPDSGPVAAVAVAAGAAPAPAASREVQLETRIKQLESMVNKLSTQMNKVAPPAGAAAAGSTPPVTPGAAGGAAAPATPPPPNAPGQSPPPNPPISARFNSPPPLDNIKANVKFGPGFETRTTDDQFILQFHNLTQFDYRGYQQGGQTPVKDTFAIPRQWWMFSGRVQKSFGYFVSFQSGFDVFSLLDVFADIDLDPRLRFRIGRYKTPFTYEFYVEPIQGLVVPERSVFFNNFGQNRDLGVMALGRVLNNKVDYAAGIFNGTRNGFLDNDNSKDVSAFLNYKPFGDEQNTLLENLNIGGSVFAGDQNHPPVPTNYRTVVPTLGNPILGVPFFQYNNNVASSGPRAFWDLHAAYYYGGLALLGEWGSGFENYARTTNLRARTQVPVDSFYLQASYLVTGETRSSLGIVKPLNPVTFKKGHMGTGALEPFVRYEYLDYGSQVFTSGLADPNLWTNRMFQTHVGFNWHLTQYVKFYFDWNHSEFAQPVLYSPGHRQKTSDMFLARLQLYF